MNPFFDISHDEKLPDAELPLRNLGTQLVYATIVHRGSDFWRTAPRPSKTLFRDVTDQDYDQQFVTKLCKWKPVYNLEQLAEHHYKWYIQSREFGQGEFLKHMRYVILPYLKKRNNADVCVELFVTWLEAKEMVAKKAVSGDVTRRINKTAHRIHFDDLSWSDFERLIFAYVKRIKPWNKLSWLGQSGRDGGMDIWGEYQQEAYIYQCANYKALTIKKAKEDIDKLVDADDLPDHLIIVCGGKVSAQVNKSIGSYAKDKGIADIEVWSGADIEEGMRINAPELLKRFFDGESFPELR